MSATWQDHLMGQVESVISDPLFTIVKVARYSNEGTLYALHRNAAVITVRYGFQEETARIYLDGIRTGGPSSDTRYNITVGERDEVDRLLLALTQRRRDARSKVLVG